MWGMYGAERREITGSEQILVYEMFTWMSFLFSHTVQAAEVW